MAPRPPLPPFTEETARQKVLDEDGYMRRREASINDVPVAEADRRIFGPRPEGEQGQSFPVR
jgi:nuclear transport factor 2 (NTF2) superfamily protein